jgi:hypothetical protein
MALRLGYDAGHSLARNRMTTGNAEIDVQQFHDGEGSEPVDPAMWPFYIQNDALIRSI